MCDPKTGPTLRYDIDALLKPRLDASLIERILTYVTIGDVAQLWQVSTSFARAAEL